MQRSHLIVSLALLATPAFAQDNASTASASLPPTPAMQTDKPPVAALTFGYLYVASETAPGAWQWHLHGFFGIPQVNIKPWLGVIADFTQSYNTSAGAHENVQSILSGPIVTFAPKKKISPFVFADAGRVRDSKNGTISSLPAWAAGGGFAMKLNKHLGLLLVPGEYIQTYPPTGTSNTLNNFTARFGITLPLYK